MSWITEAGQRFIEAIAALVSTVHGMLTEHVAALLILAGVAEPGPVTPQDTMPVEPPAAAATMEALDRAVHRETGPENARVETPSAPAGAGGDGR